MKKILILFVAIGIAIASEAQDGYRVSGKIDGVPDGTLLLISGEKDHPDTLGITRIVSGAFVFTGKIESPTAAYITTAERENMIPLILENANFMVNAGKTGILIKGGEQQEIYSQFSKINMNLLQEQRKITEEFRVAEQKGNRVQMQALTKQLEDALTNARQKELELLEKYGNTYVAAYVVATGMRQLDEGPLKARYALLGDVAKESVPGRSVMAYLGELERLSEGNIAPDFTIASPEGDSLSLHPVKGKLKLIHFWTSNNSFCREVNVALLALYQKCHLKGLEIISVSEDQERPAWMKAINEDGMVWKHGLDRNAAIYNLYHVKKIPYLLLLDSENRIVAKDLPVNDLQKRISELLKQYRRVEKK